MSNFQTKVAKIRDDFVPQILATEERLVQLDESINLSIDQLSMEIFDVLCAEKQCELERLNIMEKHLKLLNKVCEKGTVEPEDFHKIFGTMDKLEKLNSSSPLVKFFEGSKPPTALLKLIEKLRGVSGL